jgi:hypothetical protein
VLPAPAQPLNSWALWEQLDVVHDWDWHHDCCWKQEEDCAPSCSSVSLQSTVSGSSKSDQPIMTNPAWRGPLLVTISWAAWWIPYLYRVLSMFSWLCLLSMTLGVALCLLDIQTVLMPQLRRSLRRQLYELRIDDILSTLFDSETGLFSVTFQCLMGGMVWYAGPWTTVERGRMLRAVLQQPYTLDGPHDAQDEALLQEPGQCLPLLPASLRRWIQDVNDHHDENDSWSSTVPEEEEEEFLDPAAPTLLEHENCDPVPESSKRQLAVPPCDLVRMQTMASFESPLDVMWSVLRQKMWQLVRHQMSCTGQALFQHSPTILLLLWLGQRPTALSRFRRGGAVTAAVLAVAATTTTTWTSLRNFSLVPAVVWQALGLSRRRQLEPATGTLATTTGPPLSSMVWKMLWALTILAYFSGGRPPRPIQRQPHRPPDP